MNLKNKVGFFIIFFLTSILTSVIWTYENFDTIDNLKIRIKHLIGKTSVSKNSENKLKIEGNSYSVELTQVLKFKQNTAFLLKEYLDKEFKLEDVQIFTQDGYQIFDNREKKLNLGENYKETTNSGVKLIFFNKSEIFGLVPLLKDNCFYAAIVNLNNGLEFFKTDCLPKLQEGEILDFNGLGSSRIELNEHILFSIGTPTTNSNAISMLAQDKNSFFGKILKINKQDFEKKEIKPEIFSIGHRNPQGITKLEGEIFSVEHGPKGGDELNKIILNKNYGWPLVSYGTRYFDDEDGRSYPINHEKNQFEDPIYAFVPSVAISSINNCPKSLKNYYKSNCLIALSLSGNKLRPGNSLIIFLLNENLSKLNSVEKIYIKEDFRFRHFLTNEKNEIYEDENGSIYVSVDGKGMYRISFKNFR